MKKNFVKKLALGLALVMAVTSVPASSEAAAAPGFKSSAVKVRVGQTKKYSTENSKKYSVKFKIGNKSVATIKYTAGSKSVKVTGVAEGKTTLRADFKSYKTKKVTTAKVPVTVLAAKEETPETPVVTTAELASVKQTAANKFTANFTADASATVTADSFTAIESTDGVYSAYVKSVVFSADGKTAEVTTYSSLVDGAVYNVTCAGKTASFTASVGKVKTAVITTAQAQANVATDIKFVLYDANNIDVTTTVEESDITLEVEGNYSDEDLSDAFDATITLDTVGAEATVTLTYDAVDGSDPVTTKATIGCIPTQATVGKNTMFTKASFMAAYDSGMPKPYLNTFTPNTTLYEDGEADFYFAAFDKDGAAIVYEEYEVESSNEDVINVNLVSGEDDNYAVISVSGEKEGTARVIIRATKNEVESVYTQVVTVKEEPKLSSVVLDKTAITVGDNEANDNDKIKVTLKDQYGNAYSGVAPTVEFVNDSDEGKVTATLSDYDSTNKCYWVTISANELDADDSSDEVKIAVVAEEDDKEITKKFAIKIKEVDEDKAATYKVELSKTSVDYNPAFNGTFEIEAKLAVYRGTVFSHYVTDGDEAATDVSWTLKKGSNPETITGAAATIDLVPGVDKTYGLPTEEIRLSDELDLLETGTWTVIAAFTDEDGEKAEKKATFTLKNTMEMPTVTVDSKTGEKTGLDLLKECITVDVNVLAHEDEEEPSIIGMYDKNFVDITTKDDYESDDFTVKYVAVKDNFMGIDYIYYVPVGKTFETK